MAKKIKKVKKEATRDVSAGIDVSSAPKKKGKGKEVVVGNYDSIPFMHMLYQDEKAIVDVPMADYTKDALRRYGSYVVEERAIPDYRDGQKPSHRAILWSLCGLGLRPSAGYKKAARTVGDVIGKYHPHGDQSAYGAMVTIANTMPPIVDGQGNWGTPINPAAAMRYTEARMSKFAHLFMVDSKYLNVVPTVPNFSNDDVIPLYMPALLPFLLFNGNTPAPAYGVRAGNPSFSFESVSKVVIDMLRGVEYTSKSLAKTLKIQHAYGTEDVTTRENYAEMITTGKGSISYTPLMESDYAKRVIRVRSFSPGSLSSTKTIDKSLAKISEFKGVKEAYSEQGKKSVGSGPYGALFVVECQKSLSEDEFEDVFDKVQDEVTASIGYRLGITIRHADKPNAFRYVNYLTFMTNWIKYRINLELRLIKFLKAEAERDLHIQEVYLFAVENIDKLLKVLPQVLKSKNLDETLAKLMKIPVEDAHIINERKLRQLAAMEADDIKAKIRDLKSQIAQLIKDAKQPGERAARDTEQRVATYLNNPDDLKSGLFFAGGKQPKKKKADKAAKSKKGDE